LNEEKNWEAQKDMIFSLLKITRNSKSKLLRSIFFFADGTHAAGEVGREDGSIDDESIYNARDGPSLQLVATEHFEFRVIPGGVVLRRCVSRSRLWKSRCCFVQRRSGAFFHGRLLHIE